MIIIWIIIFLKFKFNKLRLLRRNVVSKTIACAGECCWNYLTKRENDAQRLLLLSLLLLLLFSYYYYSVFVGTEGGSFTPCGGNKNYYYYYYYYYNYYVLLPWRSGLVRSISAVGGGEWLWVQAPSMVVGTPCREALD